MNRSLLSIIGLIVFLVIVIGAGILIYRFIANGNTDAKVLTINDDGKFAAKDYTLSNDQVFRIQNNSDKNQTVKKSSDKTTLVEVDANSSSRELTLSDNSETELYLSGDESQKTKVKVGTPETKEESAPESTEKPVETPTNTTTTALPETGPENNLIFIVMAALGFGLYKFSRRVLN